MIMALVAAFLELLQRPTVGEAMFELMVFMAPIWVAVLVGVLVGWAWKPKWAKLYPDFLDSIASKGETNKSGMLLPQFAASVPSLSSLKLQLPTCISWISDFGPQKEDSSLPSLSGPDYRLAAMGFDFIETFIFFSYKLLNCYCEFIVVGLKDSIICLLKV